MSVSKKNILHVGGVDDKVTEEILHAAFVPFGELKSIQVPRNFTASKQIHKCISSSINTVSDKQRGFAFIEFESDSDAADAIENMDGSELFGKIIRCTIAKAVPKLAAGKAVWSTEDWIQSNVYDDGNEEDRLRDVTLVPTRSPDEED